MLRIEVAAGGFLSSTWHVPSVASAHGHLRGRIFCGGEELDSARLVAHARALIDVFGSNPSGVYALVIWDSSPRSLAALLSAILAGLPFCIATADRLKVLRPFLVDFPPALVFSSSGPSGLSGEDLPQILKQAQFLEDISAISKCTVVPVDGIPADLLYLATSSGTTGTPKVVGIPRRTFAAFADWGCQQLLLTSKSVWAEPGSLAFDLPLTNLLLAVGIGADLHALSTSADRVLFWDHVEDRRATHVRTTPSTLQALCTRRTAPHIDVIALGGESIGPVTLDRCMPAQLYVATYGCSECGGFLLSERGRRSQLLNEVDQSVHFTNTSPHIDLSLRLVEEGDELVVSGHHLPRGYLGGLQDSTSAHFAVDPSLGLCFRTADLVASRAGGTSLVGRRGRTAKRGGDWINLDKIAASISAALGRKCAAVLNGGRLLAYVEGEKQPNLDPKTALPMLRRSEVPDEIAFLPALPVHSSGKVDVAKLLPMRDQSTTSL